MKKEEVIKSNIIIPRNKNQIKAELLLGNYLACCIHFKNENFNGMNMLVFFSEYGEEYNEWFKIITYIELITNFEYIKKIGSVFVYENRCFNIVNFNIRQIDKFISKLK